MKTPAGTITLSSEEGVSLIAQVHQSNLPASVAGRLEQIIRLYFWLGLTLQGGKLSVKRLRSLRFGPSAQLQGWPECKAEAPGEAASAEETPAVEEVALGLEAGAPEAGSGDSEGEGPPKGKGGHRAGTGRLDADADAGARRVECRHEELAVGQRCPVCGQGTLYALPAGVELRLDGNALLSAMRYELEKLRCSACGQIFTAGLPDGVGDAKYSARAVLAVSRYYLWVAGYRLQGYQAMLGVPVPDATQWAEIEVVGDCAYKSKEKPPRAR